MKKINQCDGCRAGKPVNEHGNHRMGEPGKYPDMMACTAELYDHRPGCPPDGPHCSRCGHCEFGEGSCICYAR